MTRLARLFGFILCSIFSILGTEIQAQADLSLKTCIERAWAENIEVQSRDIDRELVEIGWKQRRASMLPSLNAGATHGYNWGQTIDPFTNQFATDRVRNNNFFLSSELLLFNGFALQNDIRRAELDTKAAEEELRRTRNDIALLVAQSFVNILFNQEQLKAAQAQVDISQRQEDRMQRMVNAGQEAIASLYEVQANLATDLANQTTAENNLAVARLGLANLLLMDPSETQNFALEVPDVEIDSVNTELPTVGVVYEAALTHLPQISAVEFREKSADASWSAAKGGRSPRVSLSGSVGSGYSGANQIPTGDPEIGTQEIGFVEGTNDVVLTPTFAFPDFEPRPFEDQLDDNFNQSLSLRLTVPVFNGLQVSSDIQRTKLEQERARLNVQATTNQLLQDVQQAHADALAARRNYLAASRSREAAALNFQNAEVRFEQEMMSPVDFNVAKSNLARVEADFIRAKYDLIFRNAIIEFYMGRGIQL